MEVFQEVREIRNIAIAHGFFDGLHIGHKKIISTLVGQAKTKGIKSAVITFTQNPANYFLGHDIPFIQSQKDKEDMLESMGVDYVFELDFSNYKDVDAQKYLKDVIIKNFLPKVIVVGYNHTFGKNRKGTPTLFKNNEKKYDYSCIIVPEQKFDNNYKVSSSIIRDKLHTGMLSDAKLLLGRNYSVENTVTTGDKVATSLGFPTANLIWPENMVKLPYGVYFGKVNIESTSHFALISWGQKPTLKKIKEEVLESHIYNFNDDIYGKTIKVEFIKKIRNEVRFKDIELLKTQIQKDYNIFEKWINSFND